MKQNGYEMIIWWSVEDDAYVVDVPELPGCHTQARTITELTARVREAIQLCLEVSKINPLYRKKIRQFAYYG